MKFKVSSNASDAPPGVGGILSAHLMGLKPPQLYQLLRDSSLDLGEPGFDFATGYGLIQADRAIGLLPAGR